MKISPLAWLHREFSLPPSWTSQFVMQGKEKFTIFKVKRFSFLLSSLVEPQYYVGKVRCSQGMARNSICILYENL